MFVFQHAVPAAGIPEVSGEETMQAQRELGSHSGKPDNKVVKSYNLTLFFMDISIEDRKSQIASMSCCVAQPQKADVGKKSPHMQQVLRVACHLLFLYLVHAP